MSLFVTLKVTEVSSLVLVESSLAIGVKLQLFTVKLKEEVSFTHPFEPNTMYRIDVLLLKPQK